VILVGTAGWSIPRALAGSAPGTGSHLERYSRRLNAVEINSSFYRPHAFATYKKWAEATPSDFRFAIKVPRRITHELKLRRPRIELERFLAETAGLGSKRGPLLVQLPPSHAFNRRLVTRFFEQFRAQHKGAIVCEPRHATWFTASADRLLEAYQVARVAADPSVAAGASQPGGWKGLTYFRLHGSPRMYWSRYSTDAIRTLADTLRSSRAVDAWCVFDNTAMGTALQNACELMSLIGHRP
jgi:uncharacterized protein YecE (DUF72 family)